MTTRLLLVGHGRMGRLVESLAASHGCEIAGVVTSRSGADAIAGGDFGHVDVAVDFSLAPAVLGNVQQFARRGVAAVIGTTGWQADEADVRRVVEQAGIGVMAAANFSIGMNVFRRAVQAASAAFGAFDVVGAYIHEAHHSAKKDAPSGTALMLERAMREAGYRRPIDVSSTRAGSIPGTHTVGFDSAAETVTMTHTVRDRAVFAHGALQAATWIKGRRGWYTIDDMLKGAAAPPSPKASAGPA
jgi:4-hydroxy-tetrahydrodipicolinate reductase